MAVCDSEEGAAANSGNFLKCLEIILRDHISVWNSVSVQLLQFRSDPVEETMIWARKNSGCRSWNKDDLDYEDDLDDKDEKNRAEDEEMKEDTIKTDKIE